ncbi:hypothetical protein Tco_0025589 [Tanacetum coccineum]
MGNVTANKSKVVRCYNYKGEVHMARQCTQPKRPKNSEWFKEKMLLTQALEAGVILDEEQLAFLPDTGEQANLGQDTQTLPTTAIFQTDDLDAFDLNYDEAPSTSAVLMAKHSAYDSDVLYEVPAHDTYQDNNYLKENACEIVQDTKSSKQQDAMIMFVIEGMSNQVAKCNAVNQENKTVNESLTAELERYKEMAKIFEERQNFDLTNREKYIDSQMRGAFEKDVIPFVKSLRVYFQTFDQGLCKEINEMKAVFNQMETEVDQYSVDMKCFKIKKKELLIENDRLLEQLIFQDIMCIVMHADVENKCVLLANDGTLKYVDMEKSYIDEYSWCLELKAELSKKKDMVKKVVYNELSNRFSRLKKGIFFEINELKAQLQKKNTTIINLKDHIATLKGKSVSDFSAPVNNSNVIAIGMFKLDLPSLSPKLRKNRVAYVDYLKLTKEYADTLREIELLVYVSATCPNYRNGSAKLVVVTPINKSRQDRNAEPSTPTRVNSSTNSSGSKIKGETKNNRILRTSSSNQKNKKVDDHPRNVKCSLNNKNRISVCNASTKHAVLNANSEFICYTCNECLFNACHDMCVVAYLNDVNSSARAKSVKSNKKKEWKPTGKVFTIIKHRRLPTGRTFIIDGTKFLLTRITSTTVVPPKKPVQTKVVKKTLPSIVTKGKPKATKIVVQIVVCISADVDTAYSSKSVNVRVGNYRFDKTKETSNETKGLKSKAGILQKMEDFEDSRRSP